MRKYHSKKFKMGSKYKYEPWVIREEEFKVEEKHHNETIFALGNGYMGVRGTLEEDYTGPSESTTPGVYINGVYASEELYYSEATPNLPERSQTILNLPDWTEINLFFGNEKFDMLKGEVKDYQRILDMKRGKLLRRLIWESPAGHRVELKITRIVSFVNRHLGAIKYQIKPLNFTGEIRLISAVDGDVQNHHHLRDKDALKGVDSGTLDECSYLVQRVKSTDICVGFTMKNVFDSSLSEDAIKKNRDIDERKLKEEFIFNGEQDQEYQLTKYVTFYSSRDPSFKTNKKAIEKYTGDINEIAEKGFEDIKLKQEKYFANYWRDMDIKIEGDLALQQAIRFNAFHLLQATGRGGQTNIAAKGLTGEYYEGHYFWDTETYMVPFFLYSEPQIARDLLLYRYNFLDKARRNARRVKLKGVLYPWRTINGKEASGFFMGSTVQYHIDADIAYAINLYVNTTDDRHFLYNYGAEILVETARMWVSLGAYIEQKGNRFCLNEVCGPDEYKPGVNNNCYTNYMAKFNLEYALQVVEEMKENVPHKLQKLKEKLELKEEELKDWQEAAARMYLPYNEKLDIHPQDDSFIYKKFIDIDSIPEEELPLVRNWHPLVIWRYQVLKQADVVLLMLLLSEKFTIEEKKRNYDYYEPRTTHDSSLSPSIYSILASEIGYYDEAYNYFRQTARLDLDDYNNNAYQGIHTACMGSTWMAVVQGFAGMRNIDGQLTFRPYLPEKWDAYEFKIKYRDCRLKLRVSDDIVRYELIEGDVLKIYHGDQELILKHNKEVKAKTNV